jgi:hypothetical protein
LKRAVARLAASFLLLAAFDAGAQNLIVNGSFEAPVAPAGGFTDFPTGSTAITGWTAFGPSGTVVSIVDGTFAQLGVGFPAQSGNQWLDLSGNGSNSTEGVTQAIATVPGHQYHLTYFIGNTTGGGIFGTTSTVEVLIDGVVAFVDTNSIDSPATLAWQQFTHTFTAVNATTAVAFRNADPGGDNNNSLDDVVVIDQGGGVVAPVATAIPTLSETALAATIAMLALGALGALRRRQ